MRLHLAGLAALAVVAGGFAGTAATAADPGTEVVAETSVTRQAENTPPTDDWVLYTRAGTPPTAGAFVDGPATPPLGTGSLQLSTVTGAEKVFLFNYDHVGTRARGCRRHQLLDLPAVGQRPAGRGAQRPDRLQRRRPPGGFATLVFEPVYNTDQRRCRVRRVAGLGSLTAAASGGPRSPSTASAPAPPTLATRPGPRSSANNPDATILGGVGVNQGSGNPGLVSNVDAFTFDETTYDFEVVGDSTATGSRTTPTTA